MILTHEKINGHRELTVSSRWPRWSRLRGPMITAQSRLGEVTAQSRRGHSSVTARSQRGHGEVTAQSRHLQYDHGSVTARSQLNHGPGHGSVTADCDHFGHRELTVSSHGGQFFYRVKCFSVIHADITVNQCCKKRPSCVDWFILICNLPFRLICTTTWQFSKWYG